MAAMEVVVKLMEAQSPPYYAPPHHHDSSRPTIGFPLGTALLLIVVFSLSGIFSCCYHWDKLRHLRGEFSDADPDSDSKPKPIYSEKKQDEDGSLPVIMAGDQFARFIAMPCLCEPPRQEKITVEEEIQKPPHIAITILLDGGRLQICNNEFCWSITSFDWNEAEPKHYLLRRVGFKATSCFPATNPTTVITDDSYFFDQMFGSSSRPFLFNGPLSLLHHRSSTLLRLPHRHSLNYLSTSSPLAPPSLTATTSSPAALIQIFHL